jgi:putative N6-adenine-specific DNA methylase
MLKNHDFEIFLATAPGLETELCAEVRGKGFKQPKPVPGGVTIRGGWPEVWRANLWIRGAGRVLARIDAFHVTHLAHLDDRARRVPWGDVLRPDVPFRIEASCAKSRIYHSGAAAQRIETAISETLGAPSSPDAPIVVKARIEHDVCTISVDTSGEPLHKRGYKVAINPAPMRETLASLFLLQCSYDGSEPVVDPMCGCGTFVIEAAEIAARLNPGRARAFAFEQLATFDAESWQRMRAVNSRRPPAALCYGSDRDAGAIEMSRANAERAGVTDHTAFRQGTISELLPPEGQPGLVIVNPPYGARLGDKDKLVPLYRALGHTLATRFTGWRVGLVTSEPTLAYATALKFLPTAAPLPHGGLRISLFRTDPLP